MIPSTREFADSCSISNKPATESDSTTNPRNSSTRRDGRTFSRLQSLRYAPQTSPSTGIPVCILFTINTNTNVTLNVINKDRVILENPWERANTTKKAPVLIFLCFVQRFGFEHGRVPKCLAKENHEDQRSQKRHNLHRPQST